MFFLLITSTFMTHFQKLCMIDCFCQKNISGYLFPFILSQDVKLIRHITICLRAAYFNVYIFTMSRLVFMYYEILRNEFRERCIPTISPNFIKIHNNSLIYTTSSPGLLTSRREVALGMRLSFTNKFTFR